MDFEEIIELFQEATDFQYDVELKDDLIMVDLGPAKIGIPNTEIMQAEDEEDAASLLVDAVDHAIHKVVDLITTIVNSVRVKLVNSNDPVLKHEEVLRTEYMDMQAVYYDPNQNGYLSGKGLPPEIFPCILDIAMANTVRDFQKQMQMNDSGIGDGHIAIAFLSKNNLSSCLCATVLLHKQGLKEIADRLDDDLYLVPVTGDIIDCCAVHGNDLYSLAFDLQKFHRTEMVPNIFSDSIYYYDRKKDDVRVALLRMNP